jgi:hypothetical protein
MHSFTSKLFRPNARHIALLLAGSLCLNAVAQEISPDLVGTNLWYADQNTGVGPNATVWQQTKEMGTHVIRIGGNSFDRKMPSNGIMLQWVDQIIAAGAEPIIQVSQYNDATPLNDRVAAAADLVTFLNVTHDRKIKYWNVGNEPWLQAERPSMSTMGNFVEDYFKPMAAAMKTVDPSIKIYGPDFSDFYDEAYDDLFGGDNDITGLVPGKSYYYIDGLSWHRYPQADNADPAVAGAADMLERVIKAKNKIDFVNTLHTRTGDNALTWGVGEYNSKSGETVHTFANGQMFGQMLGYSMKYEARYIATWSMYENSGSRTGTDFSMIDGNGTPRASYQHMKFVTQYFTGHYADGMTSDNNVVAYGAVKEGRYSAMIMNRGGSSFNYTLRFNTNAIEGDNLKVNIDASGIGEVTESIGPYTTQVIVLDNETSTLITYSKNNFDNDQAPTVESLSLCGNNKPTISHLEPLTIEVGDGLQNIMLSGISDGNACSQDVTITATSSDPDIVVIEGVDYISCEANGTLKLSPLSAGQVQIALVVSDSGIGETCGPASVSTYFDVLVPSRIDVPALIEAEDFSEMEGLEIGENDVGGGQHIGYIDAGDFAAYYINVPTAGNYAIQMRIASNLDTASFALKDSTGNALETVAVPNTGGWQTFQTITLLTPLVAGKEIIYLDFLGAGVNIDWIEVKNDDGSFTEFEGTVGATPIPTPIPTPAPTPTPTPSQPDTSSGGGSVNLYMLALLLIMGLVSASKGSRLANKVSK